MAEKKVSIVLKLDDKVTKPLKNVQSKFEGFVNQKFGWSKQLGHSFSSISKSISGMAQSSGLTKMAGAVSDFGSSAGKVAIESAKLAGIAGLAAGGLLAMVKQTSAVGDGLVNTAKRIGFGVEAFQEFQYAAEQNGVAAEDFSKSVEGFTKRLGEAKAGQGALFTFLKKTNPQLLKQALGAKTSEEAFGLMLNTIGGMKDASKQAAFANLVFGKSGQRMINVANQGADGIAALRAEARALGVMTDEQAESANKFGDTLGSIEVAFAAIRNTLSMALIPELQALADQFKAFIIENKPQIQLFAREIAAKLPEAIRKASEAFKSIIEIVSVLVGAFTWMGDTFGYTKTIIALLAATIGKGLTIALWGAIKATWAFGAALLTTPIGWITLGIAAIVGALYLLWKHWGTIWEGIKSITAPIIDWIVAAFDKVVSKFSGLKDMLPSWLGGKTSAEVNLNSNSSPAQNAVQNFAEAQSVKNESQIKVSFDNLPKGARVDTAGSKNVETDFRMGLMGVSTI